MSVSESHLELLKKLADGTISPYEQWMLERLSLDDPFLAEALEGYYNNNVHDNKVNQIKFQVKTKTKKLWPSLAVAASLLALLGISYFFLLDRSPESGKLISMHEESAADIQKTESPALQGGPEITQKASDMPDHARVKPRGSNSGLNDSDRHYNSKRLIDTSIPVSLEEQSKSTKQLSKPPIMKAQRNADFEETQALYDGINTKAIIRTQHISGRVINENGAPIRGAEVFNSSGDTMFMTDEAGQFHIDGAAIDNLIITRSEGYMNDSSIAAPKMAIQLRRAEDLSGTSSVLKEADMSNEELTDVYISRLDILFATEDLDCIPTDFQSTIIVGITIAKNNTIKQLRFPDGIPEHCQADLRIIFENAGLRNVFSDNREIFFNYEIRR